MPSMPPVAAARLLLNVAQDLTAQPDLAATYERIASVAVTVTGCTSAAILTATPSGESRVTASTDPMLDGTAIRSEGAYPLRNDGSDFGVLSLRSVEDGFFTDDLHTLAEIYAGHAVLALQHVWARNKALNLEIGLVSNRDIGVAVGVLMTRHRVTDQEAFDMLRVSSQRHHRKLRDIAAEVALTGLLPADAPRRSSPQPAPRRLLAVV
jgi:GAF domain-containing protein